MMHFVTKTPCIAQGVFVILNILLTPTSPHHTTVPSSALLRQRE